MFVFIMVKIESEAMYANDVWKQLDSCIHTTLILECTHPSVFTNSNTPKHFSVCSLSVLCQLIFAFIVSQFFTLVPIQYRPNFVFHIFLNFQKTPQRRDQCSLSTPI